MNRPFTVPFATSSRAVRPAHSRAALRVLFIIGCFALVGLKVQASTINVPDYSDTYVQSNTPSTAIGSHTTLLVKTDTSMSSPINRDAYVLFDLAGFTSVTAATLNIHAVVTSSGAPSITTSVYGVSNNTWQEGYIDWDHKIDISGLTALATQAIGTSYSTYGITSSALTGYLNSQISQNHTLICLVFHNTSSTSNNVKIDSRQSSFAPTLSITGVASVPNTPQGFQATTSGSQVKLSWVAPKPLYNISSYTVTRSGNMPATLPVPALRASNDASLNLAMQMYSDTLPDSSKYTYSVVANNNAGPSGSSNTATAKTISQPDPPSSLTAKPGNAQIELAWTAPASWRTPSGGVQSYNIYRRPNGGSTYTLIQGGWTSPSYIDKGRVNATGYDYQVSAVNTYTEADGSPEVYESTLVPLLNQTPYVFYTLSPSDDTYIEDTSPTTIFGTMANNMSNYQTLVTKKGDKLRYVYLKYNLSLLPVISTSLVNDADLFLFGQNTATSPYTYSDIDSAYPIFYNGWAENTLNYNNASSGTGNGGTSYLPDTAKKLDSTTVASGPQTYYDWSLGDYSNTDFLHNHSVTGNFSVAIGMDNPVDAPPNSPNKYNSKDSASGNLPVLWVKLKNDTPKMVISYDVQNGAVASNIDWENDPNLSVTPSALPRTRKMFIEYQRFGATYIETGIAREDPELIDKGLRILSWAFARQNVTSTSAYIYGSFIHSNATDSTSDSNTNVDGSLSTQDPFHSTSLFVEAAARATLALQTYNYAAYQTYIDGFTSHLHAAASWLKRMTDGPPASVSGTNSPPSVDKWHFTTGYTHRYWLLAACFGETAQLELNTPTFSYPYPDVTGTTISTSDLEDEAVKHYVNNFGSGTPATGGLGAQLPDGTIAYVTDNDYNNEVADHTLGSGIYPPPAQINPADSKWASFSLDTSAYGVNPEQVSENDKDSDIRLHPGYDVSYQAVGMNYAARFASLPFLSTYVFSGQTLQVSKVLRMLEKGLDWETKHMTRPFTTTNPINDLDNGILDITGCSRMGREDNRNTSSSKQPDTGQLANCFSLTYGLENPAGGTNHQNYFVWAGRINHDGDKISSSTRDTYSSSIAVDGNINGPTYNVALQKVGVDYVEFGIAREDTRTANLNNINIGVNILNWSFGKQTGNGSFGSAASFYGAVQFVEAAARAMLDLKAYSTAITGDMKPSYTNLTSQIQLAAEWLHSNISANTTDLASDTRKSWGLAAALGETAQLIGDTSPNHNDYVNFLSDAQTYALQALGAQWTDGSNPLNGQQPDTTTQAEGIFYAEEYLLNTPGVTVTQANDIKSMVQSGLEWETQWIDINGQIGFADPNRTIVNAFNLCVNKSLASTTKTTSFTTTAQRISDTKRM